MTDEREEQSHRLNNRKKSDAAKHAWRKHHYNYMKGNREKSRHNYNSFFKLGREVKELREINIKDLNRELTRILNEAKEDKNVLFDYEYRVLFDNISGGLSFSINKITGEVSFSTYMSDEGGKGNYKVENGSISQDSLRALYDNIKDKILTLATTIDESVKQILSENGLRETA